MVDDNPIDGRDSGGQDEDSRPLSADRIFGLLSNHRRRYLLFCLDEHYDLTLPDLADVVAENEHDAPINEISRDAVLEIYLSLWHTHVPKLVDADAVRYDQERDVVTITESGQTIATIGQIGLEEIGYSPDESVR